MQDPRKKVIVNFTPIEPMQPMSLTFNAGASGSSEDVKSKVFTISQPIVRPENLNDKL